MKIKSSNPRNLKGSVLVITLTIVVLSAIVLASYLTLVQYQTASVARSQSWNTIIPVSEAGVEEAMAEINRNTPLVVSTNFSPSAAWTWTNTLATDGWTALANGVTTRSNTVDGANYYTVTIDISSGTPTINSVGVVPYTSIPWVFSMASQPFFFAAGGNSFAAPTTTSVGRKVQMQTALTPLFLVGIACRKDFNMSGKNATVNSFNSGDTNYSQTISGVAGQYNPANPKSGGDVGVDGAVVGDVNVGNGSIFGHLFTGPGSTVDQVQLGPNGTVGPIGSPSGIANNWWAPTFNVNFPDVSAPTYIGQNLPTADLSGIIHLVPFVNYTVLAPPSGVLSSIGPNQVWLKYSGSTSLGVTITNSGSIELFVGRTSGSGDSLSLSGNGTMNYPGLARNLQIYGLPSLTSIDFSGNAAWCATIYAPEADFKGGGGGNNTQDSIGAIAVNSATLVGHWNFHYDESLKTYGPTRGWVGKSWTEVKYP
jgi:Tfp pilus assembly protein PilX